MKKPLALFITDTHLTADTVDVNFHVFDQVVKLCLQYEIKVVVLGGDVFTSRTSQSEAVLTAFGLILDFFKDHDLNVICVPGNHDKTDLTSEESFLNPYVGRPNFVLYKDVGMLYVEEHRVRFHFIPYFDETLTYQRYLEQVLNAVTLSDLNILFTHVAINGVRNNDGSTVSNGLAAASFQAFHKVLVGHYHNRQLFQNIVYTGAAYQANFGEDEHKGVTIVYSDGTIEFIELDFPRYNTFKCHLADTFDAMFETISKGDVGRDHIKLKLQFKPDVAQTKKVEALQRLGVRVEYEYESYGLDQKTQVVWTSSFERQDILEYFDQWCEEQGIQEKEFGLKQLHA